MARLWCPLVLPLGRPPVLAHWRRRGWSSSSPVAALLWRGARVHRWRAADFGGVCFAVAAPAVRAPAAHEDAEHNQTTDAGSDSNNQSLVALKPVLDFATKVAVAVAVFAETTSAGRAVEEVLLHAVTRVGAESGTTTAQSAAAAVAGIRVVILRVASHDRLALQIARRALAARTCHVVGAAARRVLLVLVLGAVRVGSGAALFGVAFADTGAADGRRRRELAIPAAVLVGVVAHSVRLELARSRIAAVVIATSRRATAIALLVALDDSVTASLACDGSDVPVVGEAG